MARIGVPSTQPDGVSRPFPSASDFPCPSAVEATSCIHPAGSLLFLRQLKNHSTELILFLDPEKTIPVTPQTVQRLHGKVAAGVFAGLGEPAACARTVTSCRDTSDEEKERLRQGQGSDGCGRSLSGGTACEDSSSKGDGRSSGSCHGECSDSPGGIASCVRGQAATEGGAGGRGGGCRDAREDSRDDEAGGEAAPVADRTGVSPSEVGAPVNGDSAREMGSGGSVRAKPARGSLSGERGESGIGGPGARPRSAESFSVQTRQEGGNSNRCWCHDVTVLEGTLTVPAGVAGPAAHVDERIRERVTEAAAFLRNGSEDGLAFREGLMGRALMQCHFHFDSNRRCTVWPEALIDPAEDILVRERRASVTRRLRDSVPPSIAAGLAAEPPPLANHISETTPPGESPGFSREGVHHGVSAPTAGMHGEAAGKFSVSAPSQLAEHASQRFSSLNLRIGERSYSGSLLAAFSNTHATNQFRLFLESVLGDKQRSLTPRKGVASADDEHFETVLMQQLLFMLWGPPDAVFSSEVLACRPSVWRPLLAACPQCKGQAVEASPQYPLDRAGSRSASTTLSSLTSSPTGSSACPSDSGARSGITLYSCTCSRFRSCVLPLLEDEVAAYLQEDMLLLPDSELNDKEQDGAAPKRLVQYAFTAGSEGEDSSDSWNYEPSSTSSSSDDESSSPPFPNSEGAVALPVSAPRRRLAGDESADSVQRGRDSRRHGEAVDDRLNQSDEHSRGMNGSEPPAVRPGTGDTGEVPASSVHQGHEGEGRRPEPVTGDVEVQVEGKGEGLTSLAFNRESDLKTVGLAHSGDQIDSPACPSRRLLPEATGDHETSPGHRARAPRDSAPAKRRTKERSLNNAATVVDFRERVGKAISLLGDSCVPFVDCLCPTDARWMVAGASFSNRGFGSTVTTRTDTSMAFACSRPWEVLLLLKSSQKIGQCLDRPLRGCADLIPSDCHRGFASARARPESAGVSDKFAGERVCEASRREGTVRKGLEGEEGDCGRKKEADHLTESIPAPDSRTSESRAEQRNEGAAECTSVRPGAEKSARGNTRFRTAVSYWTRHRVALPLWAAGEDHECGWSCGACFPNTGCRRTSTVRSRVDRCFLLEDSCRDSATEDTTLEQAPVYNELCLVETKRLEEGLEFRCFVAGNRLLGISQRFPQDVFSFLARRPALQENVRQAIVAFFESKVVRRQRRGVQVHSEEVQGEEQLRTSKTRAKTFLRRFVFDVYLQRKKTAKECSTQRDGFKCWLLNVLPWGGATESLLFKWDELRRIAYTEIQDDTHQQPRVVSAVKTVGWSVGKDGLSGHLTQVPELRIVGTQDQNAGYIAEGALQLPKELLDIAAAGARSSGCAGNSLEHLLSDLEAAHADLLKRQKSRTEKQAQADNKKA